MRTPARTWILIAALAAVAGACRRTPNPPRAETAPAAAPAQAAVGSAGSVYDLDLALTDEHGRVSRLADLAGRPVVAAMIYTSCTSVCPMITAEMKTIERQLGSASPDVQFALFSLDPHRDTPAALRQFATAHGLTSSRWRLFATSEEGVRELSAVFGLKYATEDTGDIAHSAEIIVIDRRGVIQHEQMGLTDGDAADLLRAVDRAS